MDTGQRRVLQENRVQIVQDLEPRHVIDYLQEDGILTENDAERISTAPTRRERCQLLLSMLPTRGPSAYGSFQTSLKKSKYNHLERLLDQASGDCDSLTYENQTFETDDRRSQDLESNTHRTDVTGLCSTCRSALGDVENMFGSNRSLHQVLVRYGCLLLHNIDPVDLLDRCIQDSVLNDDDCDIIKAERTRRGRCVAFFKQLSASRQKDHVVNTLKRALEAKYSYIVVAIEQHTENDYHRDSSLPNDGDNILVTQELKEPLVELGGQNLNNCGNKFMDLRDEGDKELMLSVETVRSAKCDSLPQIELLKTDHPGTIPRKCDEATKTQLKSSENQEFENCSDELQGLSTLDARCSEDKSKGILHVVLSTGDHCIKSEDTLQTEEREDETGLDCPDSGPACSPPLSGVSSSLDPLPALGETISNEGMSVVPCPSLLASPGAVRPHQLPNKRLTFAFNHLSTLINQGNFQQFDTLSSNLRHRFPGNHDLMCILGYLNASRDLFRTDFDSAKRHIKNALEIVPKTSNPQYFTVELYTAKARMYITQKRLEKLQNTIDDVMMLINTDPVGCSGRAAGWLYINDARNKTAQLGVINLSKPGAYQSYNKVYELAKSSFLKSMENFSIDGGKDGPFGFGYALCRLAILLLRCGDNGLTMNTLHPLPEDVELAGKHLHHLEHSDIPISKILDMHFCLAKSDFQFRKKNMVRALENAQKAYELATDMNLMEFKEHAHNRVKFLSTRSPLVVEEIDDEEADRILFGSSDDSHSE